MVRPYNECTYCGLVDIRGLYSSIDLNTGALCRDCFRQIPSWINIATQGHRYLKARIKKGNNARKKPTKM